MRTRGRYLAEDVWSGWNCVLTEVVVALLIAKGCDPGVERWSCRVEQLSSLQEGRNVTARIIEKK